jgi:hypothetical protein
VIDLTKPNALPDTITVDGREFKVYTDFRVWIRFEISLTKMRRGELLPVEYLFPGDMPNYCDINSLLEFSRPKNELPRQIFGNSDVIVLDYELDSDLIYSAFLGQYSIDLVEVEHLHWHKFLALLSGLNDSTRLREVMGYRCYEKSTEKEEVWREKLRRAWEIDRMSAEEREELDEFSRLFTK